MIQRRGSLRFSAEPFERLMVAPNLVRPELERDEPVQPSVLGLIDNTYTHPAATELFKNAVVRDGLAEQVGGSGESMRGRCRESLSDLR